MSVLVRLAVSAVRAVFFLWDVATFPVSWLVYRPWIFRKRCLRQRGRIVERNDHDLTFESVPFSSDLRDRLLAERGHAQLNTMDKLFEIACELHEDKPCLGTRPVFGEESEEQPGGRTLTKLVQADEYTWQNYRQVHDKVEWVGRGLAEAGVTPGDKAVIYADTKADWLLAALGCFKHSVVLVTLYTNLGEDGVVYGIGQTEAKYIITSQELLPKLEKLLPRLPSLRTIICLESSIKRELAWSNAKVQLIPFSKLVALGQTSSAKLKAPGPDDLAIIMYTSGSTGNPKGALLSHDNVAKAIISCLAICGDILTENRSPDEAYLAYLPLAHIFELTMEIVVMLMGVRVGFSSPHTLIDTSMMIKRGQKGDATVLQPTYMVAVPVILDRIYKGMRAKIQARGVFFEQLFNMFFRYRMDWVRRGHDTPLLNRLVFSKMRAALGGKIRLLVGGGAPLSADVHDFLRTCLTVHLTQGYGLTETVGGIALADTDDLTTGEVGKLLPDIRVKLEDWPEGGYTVQDKEGPRGEVLVSAASVAKGYYDMPDKTAESFVLDTKDPSVVWFRTGDIGQLMPSGTLKIIDRKKDLVKLQNGEYVSLGKVESCLKVHPLVDNVCVYADSRQQAAIALVIPNDAWLREVARGLRLHDLDAEAATRDILCANPVLAEHVLHCLTLHARPTLEKFEIPRALALLALEQWEPEKGLVTAALKLKRKRIQVEYQPVIDRLYAQLGAGSPKAKLH